MVCRKLFMGIALALSAVVVSAFGYVDRMFARAFAAFVPRPDFAFDYGVSFDYIGEGTPVDPAVLQELRHEAGMRRVAAARNV